MNRYGSHHNPVNLLDYNLKLTLDCENANLGLNIHTKIGCSTMFISFFTVAIFYHFNLITLGILLVIFTAAVIYMKVFVPKPDITEQKIIMPAGELTIDTEKVSIKLFPDFIKTYSLSEVTFKLKFSRYDGEGAGFLKKPSTGNYNIVEVIAQDKTYSYYAHITFFDIRAITLYAEEWSKKNYKYGFYTMGGRKLDRLPVTDADLGREEKDDGTIPDFTQQYGSFWKKDT